LHHAWLLCCWGRCFGNACCSRSCWSFERCCRCCACRLSLRTGPFNA
jgi:hypothetical protein